MKLEHLDINRFWSKVAKGNSAECWDWIGNLYKDGYGQVMINKTSRRAHRISYELTVGPIPAGMVIMHKCDNRKCVNPNHLCLGTQKENIHDMIAKGRKAPIYRQGSLNGRATIAEDDIRYIRAVAVKGRGGNVQMLAEKYSITTTQVLSILSKKSWSHI